MNNHPIMSDKAIECRCYSRSLLIVSGALLRPIIFFATFAALLLLSCLVTVKAEINALTPRIDRTDVPAPEFMVYRVEPTNTATRNVLRKLEPYQLRILEKINRADRQHLPKLPEIVVPGQWVHNELIYSPLPRNDLWAVKYAKALVVDQRIQAFGAYEYGRLVRWGPVSTGRRSRPTPPGFYHLNWRSRGRHSTVNPRWYMPWYFNFDNARGLSMHAYSLPGYPASHACVRLLEYDAKWLYDWGEQATVAADQRTILKYGTPVWIVGRYNYKSTPPWRLLPGPSHRPGGSPDEALRNP
ncbi:MAG: L,D-transpeptidase [Gammaproteobacteria bacterium]